MIGHLKVSQIALIENADLTFGPGLTVLSGETGAGKTALISACKLLVGERADSDVIREGASSATVEGTFTSGGSTLEVRRRIDRGGRSRCWIDGKPVSVSELASRIGPLLDLSGQHEHQRLLSPASHLGYFDAWVAGELEALSRAYREAYLARDEAKRTRDEIVRARSRSAQDLEVARFTISQIEQVAPVEGEYEELERELPTYQHAEALAGAASTARDLIASEGGAADALAQAADALGKLAGVDSRLDDLGARIADLAAEADDIGGELRSYRDSVEFDPQALQQLMDRLSALDGLCKRYGPRIEDVFARLQEARRTVEERDTSDEGLERAEAALSEAEQRLVEAARALCDKRHDSADAFSQALTEAVSTLGMGDVSLLASVIDLPREAWTPESPQRVEFLYSPGKGVAPKPLAHIASGGELSRVMLALKGTLDVHGDDAALVFDEVDAGIGGATAYLVGRRLSELSEGHQTIVVTHLAQIAAFADEQMVVEKDTSDDIPSTGIRPVTGDDRVAEIARMLSGRADDISLEHARTLLAECRGLGTEMTG